VPLGVPPKTPDPGRFSNRIVRRGRTVVFYDRLTLQNGRLTNQNTRVRPVRLSPRVRIHGGFTLPATVSTADFLADLDAGLLADVNFTLRFDDERQVDEIRELP
jgi:hypothetical protein